MSLFRTIQFVILSLLGVSKVKLKQRALTELTGFHWNDKSSSLASIVSSTNMAATSLSFESLGSIAKPSHYSGSMS